MMKKRIYISGSLFGFLIALPAFGAQMQSPALDLPQVRSEKTHLVPSFWAELPRLKAKTTLRMGIQSDNFAAIIKQEDLKPSGSRIAILRCRERDAISFRRSCKWVLTYLTDISTLKPLGDAPIAYRHCVYYYSNQQTK